jgi:micrococcal nuclease
MYEYRAEVLSVYDGDTVTLKVNLGFKLNGLEESFRLYGVNTPELRSRRGHRVTPEEKAKAIEVRDWVRSQIPDGSEVVIRTYKDRKGKYGRWLAVVMYGEEGARRNLNNQLIEMGYPAPPEWN